MPVRVRKSEKFRSRVISGNTFLQELKWNNRKCSNHHPFHQTSIISKEEVRVFSAPLQNGGMSVFVCECVAGGFITVYLIRMVSLGREGGGGGGGSYQD